MVKFSVYLNRHVFVMCLLSHIHNKEHILDQNIAFKSNVAPNSVRVGNPTVYIEKEGNDQGLIQLPNTLRPRHQRERRTHLQQRHHNQNTTGRKPTAPQSKHYKQKAKRTVSFFPKNWPNGYPKLKFHQSIHAKKYNDYSRWFKIFLGVLKKNSFLATPLFIS